MPNRKTFDEREKVDHSSHPLEHRQPSDLQPDIQDSRDKVVKAGSARNVSPSRRNKPPQ